MNTSQPVSSQIRNVHFTFLPSSEIRALSAKRITTSTTFDTLLNPTPGGLYSLELGQFGDNACTTCGLKSPQCPGHCGHIELPVPCYHPTFFDQVLKLLRGTCSFCQKLKLSRHEIAKFICKLRLVRRGLLKEAADLEKISPKNAEKMGRWLSAEIDGKAASRVDEVEVDDDSDEDDTSDDIKSQVSMWEKVTKRAIAAARLNGTINLAKTEATTKARQQIIGDFMRALNKSRTCGKCGAINPSYRKDKFVKIFQKALSERDRTKNIQGGHKSKNALVEQARSKEVEKTVQAGMKRKRDEDEGVADMDTPPEEDDDEEGSAEGGDEEREDQREGSESEQEIAGAVDDTAAEGRKEEKPKRPEQYLNPSHVQAELEAMFAQEQEIFSLVYGGIESTARSSNNDRKSSKYISADMFFMRDILVPPNRYRPEARAGAEEITEAQENSLYRAILTKIDQLRQIQRQLSGAEPIPPGRTRSMADLERVWAELQDAVNSLVDRDRNPMVGAAGRRNADGIKQKLEKKEGMFRKYMMGKRVNFAARTVISPDPNIETNEIGVPPVFAVKLTYPEPVNNWNIEDLQQAVRNGAFTWPGAVAIENENGQVINLERKTPDERLALANQLQSPPTFSYGPGARGTRPKKVHRHLHNGDIVIMNRQPTLHKPSMMCHRARVLPGEKTLRMHYANCNTYNADFDGDEMNLHFPQNDVARAEALSIADTDHQYLSGTAGNPLRGLIQDHISMGVWLTNRDTFFERAEYMQLLYAALRPENGHCQRGRIETVPPAIFKPRKLWTGKQVVTSILKNVTPETHQGLTMTGKSTTEAGMWGVSISKKATEASLTEAQMRFLGGVRLEDVSEVHRQTLADGSEESGVLIQDGYLCHGILDKKQIGPSSGGFVNGVYEAYGHTIAGRLLSVLGRLLTRMLQIRAFSCGVEDLIFTKAGELERKEALSGAGSVGLETAAKYVSLLPGQPESVHGEDPNVTLKNKLDGLAKDDRELKRRLEDVLRDDSKQKFLDSLTQSATSKLSSAVTNACLPTALVKPFPKNQMQAMTSSGAKGSKVNANQISCNLGQQNLEGRRVPVMVSGKTLPCFAPFETSVRAGGYIVDRFLTGVRPQEYFFHAMSGREGLIDTAVKTSRSGYLQRCLIKGMEGLRVEYDTTVRDTADGSMIQFLYGEDGLDVAKAKYLSDHKFAAENHLSLFHSFSMREHFDKIMSEEASEYNKNAEKAFRRTNDLAASDPVLSRYSPAKFAGSTSEKALKDAREYIMKNPDKLIRDKKNNIVGAGVTRKNFQAILDLRYLRSVVESGEAVGVVAGQSIGEPSTQMTLNTFHLAGASAKNVTQGIPRLREILMTAAGTNSMATPSMILKLNEEIAVEEAKKFAKGIAKLSLAGLVDKVTVTERQGLGVTSREVRKYEVRLDLFPKEEYTKEYAITVEEVIAAIEHRFLPLLQANTRKEIKRRGDEKGLKAQIGEASGTIEQQRNRPQVEREGGDDDSDGEGDDDATRDKSKNNKQQAGYEAMEDEDEAAMAQRNQPVEDDDETYGGSEDESSGPSKDVEAEQLQRSIAKDRQNRIRGSPKTNDIVLFEFDDSKADLCSFTMEYESSISKILMLNLVEAALRSALVQEVRHISNCTFVEESADAVAKAKKAAEEAGKSTEDVGVHLEIATAGVNIQAMWSYPHILNPNLTYTNSIHEMLSYYGVEAARATIVKELQSTFAGHGVSVDTRHLTLIADYMTRNGSYQAFNRFGYTSNTSPLMKMSFETTLAFLKDAVIEGDFDELTNPSARICVGGMSKVGTGGFDVFLPLEERVEEDGVGDVEMEDS